MHKGASAAAAFGLLLSLTVVSGAAGHEGGQAKIECEPSAAIAGASVMLAGSGLEENSERVIVLSGADILVQFGAVTTDAEGTFQKELTIPSHLPPGTYEFQAIGDETLTVPFGVLEPEPMMTPPPPMAGGATPMPSMGDAGAMPKPKATTEPVDPTKTVVARDRPSLEMGLIGGFVLLAVVLGAFLVIRAERLGAFFRVDE